MAIPSSTFCMFKSHTIVLHKCDNNKICNNDNRVLWCEWRAGYGKWTKSGMRAGERFEYISHPSDFNVFSAHSAFIFGVHVSDWRKCLPIDDLVAELQHTIDIHRQRQKGLIAHISHHHGHTFYQIIEFVRDILLQFNRPPALIQWIC